jgi:hypothetical protein
VEGIMDIRNYENVELDVVTVNEDIITSSNDLPEDEWGTGANSNANANK